MSVTVSVRDMTRKAEEALALLDEIHREAAAAIRDRKAGTGGDYGLVGVLCAIAGTANDIAEGRGRRQP